MQIRLAIASDQTAINNLYINAFSEEERELVAKVAGELLLDENSHSFVAEIQDEMVGHIAFSPVTLKGEVSSDGFILSPLAVKLDHQGQKIGSSLINSGIAQLKTLGAAILFVYGDPDYYGRFGFAAEIASGYVPPYELTYPSGWLAHRLTNSCHSGTVARISCVPALHKPELW